MSMSSLMVLHHITRYLGFFFFPFFSHFGQIVIRLDNIVFMSNPMVNSAKLHGNFLFFSLFFLKFFFSVVVTLDRQ